MDVILLWILYILFKKIIVEHEGAIQDGVISADFLATKIPEISTSLYERYGPATQILDSYNHFMNHILPLILTRNGYFQHEELVDARLGLRVIN